MKKEAKIVMLPTEDKTDMFVSTIKSQPNKKFFHYKPIRTNYIGSYQHLYITTDDEIKEGDWFIWHDADEPKLFKCIGLTDNTHLQVKNTETGELGTYRKDNCEYGDWAKCYSKKIIATTDDSLKIPYMHSYNKQREVNSVLQVKALPQIPQLFIQAYCNKGGIDEVLVEYEKESYNNRFNSVNESGIKKTWGTDLQLKIDSHNIITIHPIKNNYGKKTKKVTITPPEGFEIDEKNSTFKEIVFKEIKLILPTRIEEVKGRNWFINNGSAISPYFGKYNDPNQLSTKERAAAFLALMQLVEFRDAWNGDWRPNWSDIYQPKYCLVYIDDKLNEVTQVTIQRLLYFKTAELRDKFLIQFKNLIETAKELI